MPRARRPRRHWATRIGVAAAAAVLVVAGAGGAIWHPWSRHSGSYASLAALVVTAPDAQQFRRTLADGAQLTVYRSASLGRAAIATSGLPAAPEGKVYELWLESPAGSMRPAGLMPGGADTAVALQGDATSAKGMGVTVEPAGGSPSPTSTPIVLVAFGT